MKNFSNARMTPALALATVATLLFLPALQSQVRAQGPQGGGGRPRPPFAFGKVTAVDAAAGTITISTPFGDGSQTIQTSSTTQITSEVAASVSDLKVGDQIRVQGMPTGITASNLTIGQPPAMPGGPGGRGGGGNPGGAGAGGNAGGTPQPFAMASGTIASTNPLTITLSSSVSLVVKMDPKAKVTKFSTLSLSAIKVGDRVVSAGTLGDDGTLTATTVGVNLDMNGMGPRGGLGGGGQGGRGQFGRGQGGPGGPGGCFGGPDGGPERGGPGGNPGGGPSGPGGDMPPAGPPPIE